MKSKGCVHNRYVLLNSSVEVFEVLNTLLCFGTKHHMNDVKSGRFGWKRVYFPDQEFRFIGGSALAFREGSRWQLFSSVALEWALNYDDKRLLNGLSDDGSRKDIPFHFFRIHNPTENPGQHRTTMSITDLASVPIQKVNRQGRCFIGYHMERRSCTLIGRGALLCHTCLSEPKEDNNFQFVNLGGVCPEFLGFSALESAREAFILDDQSASWWVRLIKSVTSSLVDFLSESLSSLLGEEWQVGILMACVTYYLTISLGNSVGVGAALGLVALWNHFRG